MIKLREKNVFETNKLRLKSPNNSTTQPKTQTSFAQPEDFQIIFIMGCFVNFFCFVHMDMNPMFMEKKRTKTIDLKQTRDDSKNPFRKAI